jgi:predicted RNA-binding protein YlqC (UPF0109 family)
MQAFLEYVVKGLVETPDAVTVTPVDRGGQTIYELRVDDRDVGRVIGREGMTIHALRSLVSAAGTRKGLRCTVDLIEDRKPAGHPRREGREWRGGRGGHGGGERRHDSQGHGHGHGH